MKKAADAGTKYDDSQQLAELKPGTTDLEGEYVKLDAISSQR